MRYLKRPYLLTLFTLFLLASLTGCRGPTLSGGIDTSQGIFMAIGGVILAIILMALFYAIIYAEKRWQILRVLRLKSMLRKIPGMEKYFAQGMVLQRGAQQAKNTGRMVKRYSRDFTGDGANQASSGNSKSWWGKFTDWWRGTGQTEEDEDEAEGLNGGQPRTGENGQGRTGRDGHTAVGLSSASNGSPRVVVPLTSTEAEAEADSRLTPYRPQIGRIPVPAEFTVDLMGDVTDSELIGRRIDRYQVDSLILDRPTDRIYQAYDLKMARPVALKVFRPDYLRDEAKQEALLQDIRAAAMLDHPNLVHIYDYGTAQGQLFLVSEFVNGSPINDYIDHLHEQKWHIALSHLLKIMAETARAMAQAHSYGIVHGGLTLSRILVATQDEFQQKEGILPLQVKVGSIGLTSLYTNLAETEPGRWPYLSPEQCREEAIDARSDIYALGVILYRLTAKRLPFQAESLAEARVQHLNEMPTPPSKLRPSYPLKLEEIILRAMAKDPADRYQRVSELADELAALAETVHRKGEEEYILYAGEQILNINVAGEAPRTARLDKSPIFVGSAADNDIILPGRGVSAHHMRLERDGEQWRIADLGSDTGTFLEDAHLIPELPELWLPGQTVVVGPYFLLWEEVLETRRDEVRTAVDGEQLVGISVLPMYLEVAPGEWGNLQLSLVNQGLHVDHFHVEVGGLPPEWVQISNNNVHLLPGNQTYLLLTISPPNNSTARAGLHECEIRVHPVSYPEAIASVMIEVQILESAHLLTDLHPQQLTNEGVTHLTIENQGNLALDYTVRGRNAADALEFVLPETEAEKLSLASGASNALPVRVRPKSRPWFGTAQQYPFELMVSYPNGETLTERGELQVNPRIPVWLLSLLGFLLVLLCAALLYGGTYLDSRNQQAAALAAINATPIPATPTPAPTSTAVSPLPPRTCADIFAQSNTSAGEEVAGDYIIYPSGNVELPLTVYCAENGQTYLTLRSNGGTANFATTIIEGQTLTTQYERVRLNPRTLTIDRTDRTFATVTGSLPPQSSQLNDPDFGVAIGCSRTAEQGLAQGRANIDLSGTNLALAESVTFQLNGPYDVEVSTIEIADGRQQVDLQVLGRCGWIWPQGELQLVYLLPEPDEVETEIESP